MVKYIVESQKPFQQLHRRFTAVLVCVLNIIALFGIFDITQVVGAYPLSSSWNFFDDLANWKKTGWYITGDSQMDWQGNPSKNGEVIQNSNDTVIIRDTNEFGRFYMGRDVKWITPFTLQIRMRTISEQFPFIQANIAENVNVCMSFVEPSKEPFGFDHASFHTYTMVVSEKNTVDIYFDENFRKPIISKPLDNVTQHGMGAGLIIGFPMVTTGKIVVDYVAYGNGEILEIAKSAQDVSSHRKLFSTWGGLKSQALGSL